MNKEIRMMSCPPTKQKQANVRECGNQMKTNLKKEFNPNSTFECPCSAILHVQRERLKSGSEVVI